MAVAKLFSFWVLILAFIAVSLLHQISSSPVDYTSPSDQDDEGKVVSSEVIDNGDLHQNGENEDEVWEDDPSYGDDGQWVDDMYENEGDDQTPPGDGMQEPRVKKGKDGKKMKEKHMIRCKSGSDEDELYKQDCLKITGQKKTCRHSVSKAFHFCKSDKWDPSEPADNNFRCPTTIPSEHTDEHRLCQSSCKHYNTKKHNYEPAYCMNRKGTFVCSCYVKKSDSTVGVGGIHNVPIPSSSGNDGASELGKPIDSVSPIDSSGNSDLNRPIDSIDSSGQNSLGKPNSEHPILSDNSGKPIDSSNNPIVSGAGAAGSGGDNPISKNPIVSGSGEPITQSNSGLGEGGQQLAQSLGPLTQVIQNGGGGY